MRPTSTGPYTPATVDADPVASATLGAAGGTLQARGADGARYRLMLPAGALVFDTTITMTPILDVPRLGAPAGSVRDVDLAPYALQLLHLATLVITDASGHDIGCSSIISAWTRCGTLTHVRGDASGRFSDDGHVADEEAPSLDLTITDSQILLAVTVGATTHSAFDDCVRHDSGDVWTTRSLDCSVDGLGDGRLAGAMTSPSLGTLDCSVDEAGLAITVNGTLETQGHLDELVPPSLWTGPF